MGRCIVFGIVLLAAQLGCDEGPAGNGAASGGAARGDRPNVVPVDEQDPEMTAAMAKALETLPDFIAAARAPKPTQSAFTVRAPFVEGEQTEYMAVTPVTFDGKVFHGTLDDEPVALRNVNRGDAVVIEPGRVADWSYVEDGKLVGGFTLRVLRARMTPEQRREFDGRSKARVE